MRILIHHEMITISMLIFPDNPIRWITFNIGILTVKAGLIVPYAHISQVPILYLQSNSNKAPLLLISYTEAQS